jgi:Ca-activated chloride channel family protein
MEVEVCEFTIANKPIKGVKLIGSQCTQRNPVHTIILLDTSGSMNSNSKLINVKKSLYYLLKFIPNDYLSLISFNDTSEILLENTRITPEHNEMLHFTINKLTADRGTNLSAGLLNALTLIQRSNTQIKTGLIILTDGHANEGITQSEEILKIIGSIKNNSSVSITTIAYGEDHNSELLKDVAINGGGSYNMVDNLEQVGTVFGDILGGLMSCVMQNVVIKHPDTLHSLSPYATKNGVLTIGDVYA